jgi:hypothetical protein
MTLSDAIRKGAEQHPQAIGNFFRRHPLDGIIATCVNAAALIGLVGATADYADLPALIAAYPELVERRVRTCPAGDSCPTYATEHGLGKLLFSALAHVNDTHGWTREQCADWLEAR